MIVVEIILLALIILGGAGYYLVKFGKTTVAALESEEDKKKTRLRELLSAFELHYESIIESHNIQTGIDVESFVESTFIILKPDVDALLAFVNATDENIQTQYTARYFNNTVALIDAYCSWRSKHPHLMLSEEHERKMYTSVKDVIRADIQRRLIELKGTQGGLLSA